MSLQIAKEELYDFYFNQRLSSRKIAKFYNCAYSTIDRKIKLLGFKTRTLADAHIIYQRKGFSGNLYEKAYLMGFRIGDLRVRKVYNKSETIHVDCGSTKIEQIGLIKNLFQQYDRVWISKPTKNGKIQIECFLNTSFNFLLNMNLSVIESWITERGDYFACFLAGFTDAEGSIFICNKRAIYSLGNYDIHLLKQLKKILKKYNVDSPKICCSVRKGLIASHGYKYNHDYWILHISRKDTLQKLFKLIGPYIKHPKRITDMKKAIKNIEERNNLYG